MPLNDFSLKMGMKKNNLKFLNSKLVSGEVWFGNFVNSELF